MTAAVACSLACALTANVARADGDAGGGDVTLEVLLDGGEYLPDQPIFALVCLNNGTSRPFEDLADMYLGDRSLSLTLLREGDRQPVPKRRLWDLDLVWEAPGGITVPAGECQCEAVNLVQWYGRPSPRWYGGAYPEDPRRFPFGTRTQWLPPGRYTLEAVLRAHTGVDPAARSMRIRSKVVRFEILPDSGAAVPDTTLAEFRAHLPSIVDHPAEFWKYSEGWVSRSYRSPYFGLIYYAAGMKLPSIAPDSLADGLVAQVPDSVRVAAILWQQAKVLDMGDHAKLKWLDAIGGRFSGARLIQRVVEAWQARIQQRRYYLSHGE